MKNFYIVVNEDKENAGALGKRIQDALTKRGCSARLSDRIPEDGSQFVCDAYGMRIHVKSVEKHKIVEAVVELMGDENSPVKEEKSEK